jgi:hypothetical protein
MKTDKEVEEPEEDKCSFCGDTGHTINYCNIFLAVISAGC